MPFAEAVDRAILRCEDSKGHHACDRCGHKAYAERDDVPKH